MSHDAAAIPTAAAESCSPMVLTAVLPSTPAIEIGWVAVDREVRELTELAARRCTGHFAAQFPDLDWCHEVIVRPLDGENVGDPLTLLKHGCQEKIDRGWDFAFVITNRDLRSKKRPFVVGVPSSALETAVISNARLDHEEDRTERLAVVGQYMLGQLLGLEASGAGAMRPPRRGTDRTLEPFPAGLHEELMSRLRDVADLRLEESSDSHPSRAWFCLRTLAADFRGILSDVVGYRPWYQPFRLPTLTASSFLSMVLLFLGEEAWRLGSGSAPAVLLSGALLAIMGSSLFLYHGQNLSEISRRRVLREQLVRTRWVLLLCLSIGMTALWVLLFAVSWGITFLLPGAVLSDWVTDPANLPGATARFSLFAATLGTLAGALGGNLEDERNFAANFFFDEEA